MATSKKELTIIAVVVVAVVAVLLLASVGGINQSSNHQVVNETDAGKALNDLGYEGASVESCDYLEGTNALDMPLCKITGTFIFEGTQHTYEFTYSMSGELFFREVDGEMVFGYEDHGTVTYNYEVVKETTSFSYTTSYGEYTQTADDGMKYVIVNIVMKNISLEQGVDPVSGGVKCTTDSKLTYSYDSGATRNYTGMWIYDLPTVAVGGVYHLTLVFEIPKDASASSISYGNSAVWKLDTALTV